MMREGSHAPVWLFSFVDLAFLLIIAMTQIGGNGRPGAPELGEVVVPRIHADAASALPTDARARWQLRVRPISPEDDSQPFELVRGDGAGASGEALDAESLRVRLEALAADGVRTPILAPHEDSRSGDLLEAAGLIENFWPRRRRATVEPLLALR